MRRCVFLLIGLACVSAGCHGGPIVNTGPKQVVGGTIAGIVTTADRKIAVPGRKVTVTDVNTGLKYDTTTATNGGYTIKVPEGTYRIEVELRGGETVTKHPESTKVNNGDLDPGRDFLISAAPPREPGAQA
jgi:hypothetical protein